MNSHKKICKATFQQVKNYVLSVEYHGPMDRPEASQSSLFWKGILKELNFDPEPEGSHGQGLLEKRLMKKDGDRSIFQMQRREKSLYKLDCYRNEHITLEGC